MKNNSISIRKPDIEFIRNLNSHSVRYLVIGGLAVQHYVPSRKHNDVDIWISNTEKNVIEFIKVITNMIGIIPKLTTDTFTIKDVRLPLKNLGYNIDVLNSLNSIRTPFSEAYKEKEILKYNNVTIPILSKRHLIYSKQNTDNAKDEYDITLLLCNA